MAGDAELVRIRKEGLKPHQPGSHPKWESSRKSIGILCMYCGHMMAKSTNQNDVHLANCQAFKASKPHDHMIIAKKATSSSTVKRSRARQQTLTAQLGGQDLLSIPRPNPDQPGPPTSSGSQVESASPLGSQGRRWVDRMDDSEAFEMNIAVATMIARLSLAPSMLDSKHFKDFLRKIRPAYADHPKRICAKSFMETYLDIVYQQEECAVKEELDKTSTWTVMADGYEDEAGDHCLNVAVATTEGKCFLRDAEYHDGKAQTADVYLAAVKPFLLTPKVSQGTHMLCRDRHHHGGKLPLNATYPLILAFIPFIPLLIFRERLPSRIIAAP